jgi:hypothetical protein
MNFMHLLAAKVSQVGAGGLGPKLFEPSMLEPDELTSLLKVPEH